MKKGYTLIESLVVILILAFILGGVLMVVMTQRATWSMTESRAALQLELRKAMSRISDDLKETSVGKTYTDSGLTSSFPSSGTYSAIYFQVPQALDNTTGAVTWNSTAFGYSLSNSTIIRSVGASQTNIASGISSMNFTRLANNVIQVDLGAQKVVPVDRGSNATINATLSTALAVRN